MYIHIIWPHCGMLNVNVLQGQVSCFARQVGRLVFKEFVVKGLGFLCLSYILRAIFHIFTETEACHACPNAPFSHLIIRPFSLASLRSTGFRLSWSFGSGLPTTGRGLMGQREAKQQRFEVWRGVEDGENV